MYFSFGFNLEVCMADIFSLVFLLDCKFFENNIFFFLFIIVAPGEFYLLNRRCLVSINWQNWEELDAVLVTCICHMGFTFTFIFSYIPIN